MRILIVEDDAPLAIFLQQGIERRGFRSDLAPDLRRANHALDEAGYDAVILDLGLPDGDGLAWLKRRRDRPGLPPVLVVTARDRPGDRVAGLDGGADDYLVKPVDIEELAARLRAVLRRPGPRAAAAIRIGALVFDPATRCARHHHTELALTRREADLLELLMRRAGAIVRRSSIADALYHFDEPITPNAVEAIVSRLRRKLHTAGAGNLLRTVRGVGYTLKVPDRDRSPPSPAKNLVSLFIMGLTLHALSASRQLELLSAL